MIRLYKTPWLLKKLMPRYTWQREAGGKVLYLTFDDGPIPEVTPWVLEVLAKYEAKATFFCVGENVARHPEVARQVLAQGHRLANHTFHHLKGWHTPLQQYLENAQMCQQELLKLQPDAPKLFRPPYGRITWAQGRVLQKEYELVMWDVLTNDYDRSLSPEKCLRQSVKSTQCGSIIVFHDSLKAQRNLLYALPRYVAHFTSLGYTFQTL